MTVVFVAVRGSTTARVASGALIVAGSTVITGSTSAGFVFAQDLVEILFSGAAFGSPFSGIGWFALCAYVFLGAFGADVGV